MEDLRIIKMERGEITYVKLHPVIFTFCFGTEETEHRVRVVVEEREKTVKGERRHLFCIGEVSWLSTLFPPKNKEEIERKLRSLALNEIGKI